MRKKGGLSGGNNESNLGLSEFELPLGHPGLDVEQVGDARMALKRKVKAGHVDLRVVWIEIIVLSMGADKSLERVYS